MPRHTRELREVPATGQAIRAASFATNIGSMP